MANYTDGLNAYREFPARLREAMPRDAVWVRDITLANSTWGNRIFPLSDPRTNVFPVSAAIGPGLPFGIGAAIGANGRKVVSMCGDGGFCLSLAEVWTAVQEQSDVVFVVMNDNGYGVIPAHPGRAVRRPALLRRSSGPGFSAVGGAGRAALCKGPGGGSAWRDHARGAGGKRSGTDRDRHGSDR